MKILEKLQNKASSLVLFVERMCTVNPSSASFAGVACIRGSGIRGKLKEGSKFEYQTFPNQQSDVTEDFFQAWN